MTYETILQTLEEAYHGASSTEEGSFAGDVLRACADAMAQLWSMEIDGLERRAFVSTASGDWLTKVCADRGVERRDNESDEELRSRTLEKLASLPASGNADHYAAWCGQVEDILRVRVLPLARGAGTVDILAVDRQGRCPAETVVEQAQAIVDENRPIGADAQVSGAEEVHMDITASVVLMAGGLLDTVKAIYEESLAAFCRECALQTHVVSFAKVLRLLLDMDGVADVSAFTLCGSEDSVVLTEREIPVVGELVLTEEQV